jgi:orotidine-5'-phosphate decarboxylase
MTREQLVENIYQKQSFLCVGLDSDASKIPNHLFSEEDPLFSFNKAIIDATKQYAVAYKINTAFYEAQGIKGWTSMAKTLEYIPKDCFTIADAKRGDIGNTADQYAKTFFDTYSFDSVTVNPYMGKDSVTPFLQIPGKWAIVLGLTSNKGSQDFQLQPCGDSLLYERVMKTVSSWGTTKNIMFVIGATQTDQLKNIRNEYPDHFFLIPGIGAQGGDLEAVINSSVNADLGILINVSRSIIFAGNSFDFDTAAGKVAAEYQQKMATYFHK